MTDTQLVGSTIKYGNRYLFKNVFGITTGEVDLDSMTITQEDETKNILKDVVQNIKKDDLPPAQAVGFTDKEFSRELLFQMAYDYKDLLNDEEKFFFSELRKDINSKKPYTKDQFLKDRSHVESIISRIDEGANKAFDEGVE